MQIIEPVNTLINECISLQKYNRFCNYIMSPYLRKVSCKDGVLIYNALTSEIILLSNQEDKTPDDELKQWLVNHWFYLPNDIEASSIVYMLKNQMDIISPLKKTNRGSRCIIATTTACNARCYYCYEAGIPSRTMSDEVALDVAKYIEKNGNKQTRISWFGGEPLCNPNAIRIISNYLKEHNIKFNSSLITNGYLINQFTAEELKNDWNIKNVQITLDGTKDIYLSSKNYKNEDKNAFEKVLNNIEFLLENCIKVSVRLNLSLNNGDDLSKLIDILYQRFSNYDKFSVYVRELFIGMGETPFEPTEEEYNIITDTAIKLTDKIASLGMMGKMIDILTPARNQCMADRGGCPMITPEGNLTPCEHYTDTEICGNIFDDNIDYDLLETWTEPRVKTSLCKNCSYYPKCVKIKKCPIGVSCNEAQQRLLMHRIDTKILLIYQNYKTTLEILNK